MSKPIIGKEGLKRNERKAVILLPNGQAEKILSGGLFYPKDIGPAVMISSGKHYPIKTGDIILFPGYGYGLRYYTVKIV